MGDNKRPLTVEDINAELSLRSERINMNSCDNNGGELIAYV
jgi:hypothetical protein